MELIVNEAALASAATQMIATGVDGVSETAATLAPATAIVPAGVDSVSPLAASGFAAHAAAAQVIDMFAQQEIVRFGAAWHEAIADYNAADAAGAATVG